MSEDDQHLKPFDQMLCADYRTVALAKVGVMAGVKGWLLFLCISMVLISPGFVLVTTISNWPSADILSMYNLRAAFIFASVSDVVLLLLLMYAGIRLWTVARGAVLIAKIALITLLVGRVVATLLMIQFAAAPPAFGEAVISESVGDWLRSAIYAGIWITYLTRSKRVAATYPA